ncbi:hypothetical protein [Bacillus sp. FJAT-49736]|uniref:hypothetical protein n=1 Tax=Bacillus sp. FJAT-49736 TaxID=2833582 RepID=UPI001BC9FB2C|nr:hypothetical protein [Bacillus sp. FJAT-49736]MBS4172178.1 hypothetical protein [Bacillus sp. FJAT-49736]
MKIEELNQQSLGKALIQASMTALHQKKQTLQETMVSLNSYPENELEWNFIKDLCTLTSEEIAEKWYGANREDIGFYFKE